MCESGENYFCDKCGEVQTHLVSGSGRLVICLGCGDEKETNSLKKRKDDYRIYLYHGEGVIVREE